MKSLSVQRPKFPPICLWSKHSFTLWVLTAVWQSIMFSRNSASDREYSSYSWRSSKCLKKLKFEMQRWLSAFTCLLWEDFCLFITAKYMHTMSILPVSTLYFKKLGPRVENIYVYKASFTLILIPVIKYLRRYRSNLLLLAKMRGCNSKDIVPLDADFSVCGFLNLCIPFSLHLI